MNREIILDTETTGNCPSYGHRIIEIGAIEVIDKKRTSKIFHTYLNPERSISPGAQSVHRISSSFLKDKPKFKEVAQDFLNFIGNDTLVIHNARFDTKFLNAELALTEFPLIEVSRTIDTVRLARRKFAGQRASLDALCELFGICTKQRIDEGHGALLDSELLFEVYIRLTGHCALSADLIKRMSEKSKSFTINRDRDPIAQDTKKFIEMFRNNIWKDL